MGTEKGKFCLGANDIMGHDDNMTPFPEPPVATGNWLQFYTNL